ncbi:hypothetical protein BDP55DRAFT_568834 [Colletotrichum godetiae]|uniref:Uncharacterized protein n=1 Tax=Colletotrichum godetiae TaxID=1209918 RepID=A0AAJ0A560_9PEZI|nr:uncharacterized protein BDP55DRAFT_568834 [Colletotrichum godetiae]KAK1656691.1 hypothetical protein BDP55DRAFT_568834 [Colletotrichum godetiae]
MNDEQFRDFMARHYIPGGNYELPVDDWETLPVADRLRLGERLKTQEKALARCPTTFSRSLDLDLLDARLHQAFAGGVPPRDVRFADDSECLSPVLDPEAEKIRYERESHQSLVRAGGRPLYAIDLLEVVLNDPSSFVDTLRPWLNTSTGNRPETVFQRQLSRWQDFGKWQNDNRGRQDDDGGFLAYIEKEKHFAKTEYTKEAGMRRIAEIEKNPACLQGDWELHQSLRRRQRYLCREHGCKGFEDYVGAAKRRLSSHGFSQRFDLNVDPGRQDKLTTWIEYLNYEYWWLDQYRNTIERLQPAYDKAWQELVALDILRPHETEEFLRTLESPMERGSEEEETQKNIEKAKARARDVFALTQEHPDRRKIPKQRRVAMLQTSTKSIIDAEKRARDVRTRNDHITRFIRATSEYVDARKNAARHTELVRWVEDQVPLVPSEMTAQAERPANGSRSERSAKRGLHTDESPLEDEVRQKRRRLDKETAPARPNSGSISSDRLTSTVLDPRRVETRGEILGSRWEQAMIGPSSRDSQAVLRDVRRSIRISRRTSTDRTARRLAGRTQESRREKRLIS